MIHVAAKGLRAELTRFRDFVRDAARSIFSVVEVDHGFARSLDGDVKLAGSGLPRPDVELIRHVYLASGQARATAVDAVRPTVLPGPYLEMVYPVLALYLGISERL